MTCSNYLQQLLTASCIELLRFLPDNESIIRITTKILYRIAVSIASERSSVSRTATLVAGTVSLESTLAHDTMSDDERRLARDGLRLAESLTNLSHIVAVDFDYLPAKCTILHGRILSIYQSSLGGELDIVGIIKHDKVVQTERACHTGRTL